MIILKRFFNRFKLNILYIAALLILSLIFTLLEFIGISYQLCITTFNIINFMLIFTYSFINGKKANTNGYKCGVKSGIKIIILLATINLITLSGFSVKTVFYYILIMVISALGGITGKNKQKNNLR